MLPFAIQTPSISLNPTVYAGPAYATIKNGLYGLCAMEDSIDAIYRQDSLNYIQATGYLTIDQAQLYIPSILTAYQNYFASFPYAVAFTQPALIASIENFYVNQIVVTRIYYDLFGNTTQPLNAFNYQIKNTNYSIQPPMSLAPLLARSLTILSRIDLLNIAQITDLNTMLIDLPQLALDGIITADQSADLINSLTQFWRTRKNIKEIFENFSSR